jgi:transcriptional regulator with XRE-family HTH domain
MTHSVINPFMSLVPNEQNPSRAVSEAYDFRSLLQQELLRRCKANPGYSLRAFASFLKVESSALSKILTGKRRVGQRTFQKLADRLGLDPAEQRRLAPGPLKRSKSDTSPNYHQLSLDLFQVIADWYHYAILELTQIGPFKPEHRWIAKTLGITVSEVNVAVERLLRLEMLRIDPSGKWIDESDAMTNIQNEFTNIALRKLQRQILEKSIVALETVPIARRDHTSMAINTARLPAAKEKITNFRRELCAFLKADDVYDQVYHLSVSLYPIGEDS